MKIFFTDLVLDTIELNIIYRIHITRTESPDGNEHVESYLEQIRTEKIPNDGYDYLVPTKLLNHKRKFKKVLGCYKSAIQLVRYPFYFLNSKKKLIDISVTSFIDVSKGFECSPFLQVEGYDVDTAKAARKLPDDVELDEFSPVEVAYNVGYVFLTEDFYQIRNISEPSMVEDDSDVRIDYNNKAEGSLTSAKLIKLHKVQLKRLPTQGGTWFLPVDITFNLKQFRKGYALYNVQDQTIYDVYLFDSRYGRISIYDNDDGLENCGLFKDDDCLSYTFLLYE